MNNLVTEKESNPQIIAITYNGICGRTVILNYLILIIKKSNYFLFKI